MVKSYNTENADRRSRGRQLAFLAVALTSLVLATFPVSGEDAGIWVESGRVVRPFDESPVKVNVLCVLGDHPVCGHSQTDFGSRVAMDGSVLAVAEANAGLLHVFEEGPLGWMHETTFASVSGFRPAIAVEDATIVTGSPDTSEVHVFERIDGTWQPPRTLTVAGSECLGRTVDLREGQIVAGDPCASKVHVFDRGAEGWLHKAPIEVPGVDGLGTLVVHSGTHIIAHDRSGSTYSFQGLDGDWAVALVTTASTGRAITASGNTVAVVSGNEVVVFEEDLGVWEERARLLASDASPFTAYERFGWDIDLRGGTLAVGSPRDDPHPGLPGTAGSIPDPCVSEGGATVCHPPRPGAVYVFERQGEQWTQKTKLVGDPAGDHRFGTSLAVDGSGVKIAVGAPFKLVPAFATQVDVDPEDSVYVFEKVQGAS